MIKYELTLHEVEADDIQEDDLNYIEYHLRRTMNHLGVSYALVKTVDETSTL